MKRRMLLILTLIFALGSFILPAQAANDTGNIKITVMPVLKVWSETTGDSFVNEKYPSLKGATVSVQINNKEQTAKCDGKGIAKFKNLPAGSYVFKVSHPDYAEGVATLKVNIGENEGSILIPVHLGKAKITVLDKNTNQPVRRVTVFFAESATFKAKTNDQGVTYFDALPVISDKFTTEKSGWRDGKLNATITYNTLFEGVIKIAQE